MNCIFVNSQGLCSFLHLFGCLQLRWTRWQGREEWRTSGKRRGKWTGEEGGGGEGEEKQQQNEELLKLLTRRNSQLRPAGGEIFPLVLLADLRQEKTKVLQVGGGFLLMDDLPR